MRVIAGLHKGRPLVAPKGSTTRPTTDRVREALFSSITSIIQSFDGLVVLDAYAGSGALGIEALSRGAALACFCERDASALECIRKNTAFLDQSSYSIVRLDIERKLPPRQDEPYSLLFFDPPYTCEPARIASVVERLQEAGRLAPRALLSYEHSAALHLDIQQNIFMEAWQHLQTKTYGDISVSLFQRGAI